MPIISFIGTIIVLIIILKLISLPFKLIIKFVINSIMAGILLMVLTTFLGITIALTWWAIVLIGLLGIPGLVIYFILRLFI